MEKARDLRGREQQERQDKPTPAVNTLINNSQSGRFKILERLCDLAIPYAFVQFPTVVAAHGVQTDGAMRAYRVLPISVMVLMGAVLVLVVRDSVQWHLKSFRDSARRPGENLSYVTWTASALATVPLMLALVFNDINLFEAAGSITPEMSCFGIAVLFAAALGPYMFGTCRRCGGKTPCGCGPYGGGEGGTGGK